MALSLMTLAALCAAAAAPMTHALPAGTDCPAVERTYQDALTGFDYHGEPTPFNNWPNVSSQMGTLDLCGFPKDNFFYYQAWWGTEPVLHLLPHWNWQPGKEVNVWCHTNLDKVELFVNGASQGVRDVPHYGHVEWDVVFAPGVVEARGYSGGKLILTEKRETVGAAAKIALSADRKTINADGEDLAMVTVEIQDAQGRMVPDAGNMVTFKIAGPGAVIGVGNGDPRSHEPERAMSRSAFNGLCQAIVRARKTAGDIRLEATAPGLEGLVLTITASPATPRPSVA